MRALLAVVGELRPANYKEKRPDTDQAATAAASYGDAKYDKMMMQIMGRRAIWRCGERGNKREERRGSNNGINGHLHGAAPRCQAVAAVQQHVHPVPRHHLHRLLAKLHAERRQLPRHRLLCASPASPQ